MGRLRLPTQAAKLFFESVGVLDADAEPKARTPHAKNALARGEDPVKGQGLERTKPIPCVGAGPLAAIARMRVCEPLVAPLVVAGQPRHQVLRIGRLAGLHFGKKAQRITTAQR